MNANRLSTILLLSYLLAACTGTAPPASQDTEQPVYPPAQAATSTPGPTATPTQTTREALATHNYVEIACGGVGVGAYNSFDVNGCQLPYDTINAMLVHPLDFRYAQVEVGITVSGQRLDLEDGQTVVVNLTTITINDQPVDVYTLADDPALAYIDPAVFPSAIPLTALGNLMQACNAAIPSRSSPGPGGQWATIQFGSEPGQYPSLDQLVYPNGNRLLNPDLHPCLFGQHGPLTIGSQTWDANTQAIWDYLHANYAGVVGDTPEEVLAGSARIPVAADATVVNGNLAQWVTLGSPFASDCGDGVPRIWSNDSFNGPFDLSRFDDHHGHVDIRPPAGCNARTYHGEFISVVPGEIEQYCPDCYSLILPQNVYMSGLLDALQFAGIEHPDLSLVSHLKIDFGHVNVTSTGNVAKGVSIGDLVDAQQGPEWMAVAYQITLIYGGSEYMLSPTLFTNDTTFICYPGSWYDCQPEPLDYAIP